MSSGNRAVPGGFPERVPARGRGVIGARGVSARDVPTGFGLGVASEITRHLRAPRCRLRILSRLATFVSHPVTVSRVPLSRPVRCSVSGASRPRLVASQVFPHDRSRSTCVRRHRPVRPLPARPSRDREPSRPARPRRIESPCSPRRASSSPPPRAPSFAARSPSDMFDDAFPRPSRNAAACRSSFATYIFTFASASPQPSPPPRSPPRAPPPNPTVIPRTLVVVAVVEVEVFLEHLLALAL